MAAAAHNETDVVARSLANELPSDHLGRELLFYLPFDDDTDAVYSDGERRATNPGLHFFYDKGIIGNGLRIGPESGTQPPVYLSDGNIASDTGTLSLWFKPDIRSDDQMLAEDSGNWLFSSGLGNERFYLQAGIREVMLDWFIKLTADDWNQGIWQHLAVTWVKERYTLYINGKLSGQREVRPEWGKHLGTSTTFTVGGYRYKGRKSASGIIDEVTIWRRELSSSEIARVVKAGQDKEPLFYPDDPLLAHLVSVEQTRELSSVHGNLIENGSFEAGISNWLDAESPVSFQPGLPSYLYTDHDSGLIGVSGEIAQHGRQSLSIKTREGVLVPSPVAGSARISTLAIRLSPDRHYVATAWVMTNSQTGYSAELEVSGIRQTAQSSKPIYGKRVITPGQNGWQKLTATGIPGAAYDDIYRLRLKLTTTTGETAVFHIDSLSLMPEAGVRSGSGYQYGHPLTATLRTHELANIFNSSREVSLQLTFANQAGDAQQDEFLLEVTDYNLQPVLSKKYPIQLDAVDTLAISEMLNIQGYGLFNATISRSDGARVDQITFTRLPETGDNIHIGIHATADRNILAVARKIGAYWLRLWDNGKATAWATAYPENERAPDWRYSDNIINLVKDAGFEPVGVISWPMKWEWNWKTYIRPHWIQKKWNPLDADFPDTSLVSNNTYINQWKDYIRSVTKRYKHSIKYWEVLNEPYRTGSPDWASKVYEMSIPVIRTANPGAKIIGPCVHTRHNWNTRLLSGDLLGELDVFSYHGYGMDASELRRIREFSQADHKPRSVFDTENSGSTSARAFCSECPGTIFTGDDDYHESAAKQATSLLRSIGNGTDVYFYYWMVRYDAYTTHRTFLEHDGSLTSSAAAFAIAAAMLSGTTDSRPLVTTENIEAYAFTRGSGPVVIAAWNNGSKVAHKKLDRIPGATVVRDIMGNVIAPDMGTGSFEMHPGVPFYIETEKLESGKTADLLLAD